MINLKLAGHFFENFYVRNNSHGYGHYTRFRPAEYSEWTLLLAGEFLRIYDWRLWQANTTYFSICHKTK